MRTALDDIAARPTPSLPGSFRSGNGSDDPALSGWRSARGSSYGRQLDEGRVGRGCGVGPETNTYAAPAHRYCRPTSPSWILDAPTARVQTIRSPRVVRSISSPSITSATLHPSQATTRLNAVQHTKPGGRLTVTNV